VKDLYSARINKWIRPHYSPTSCMEPHFQQC